MKQAALEQSQLAADPNSQLNAMKGEAARNRQDAGKKQSETKENASPKASKINKSETPS